MIAANISHANGNQHENRWYELFVQTEVCAKWCEFLMKAKVQFIELLIRNCMSDVALLDNFNELEIDFHNNANMIWSLGRHFAIAFVQLHGNPFWNMIHAKLMLTPIVGANRRWYQQKCLACELGLNAQFLKALTSYTLKFFHQNPAACWLIFQFQFFNHNFRLKNDVEALAWKNKQNFDYEKS